MLFILIPNDLDDNLVAMEPNCCVWEEYPLLKDPTSIQEMMFVTDEVSQQNMKHRCYGGSYIMFVLSYEDFLPQCVMGVLEIWFLCKMDKCDTSLGNARTAIRWATDYLLLATAKPDTIYVQVEATKKIVKESNVTVTGSLICQVAFFRLADLKEFKKVTEIYAKCEYKNKLCSVCASRALFSSQKTQLTSSLMLLMGERMTMDGNSFQLRKEETLPENDSMARDLNEDSDRAVNSIRWPGGYTGSLQGMCREVTRSRPSWIQ
ncbi:hypothetical protein Tco_0435677 [Tanacetum coccineum]